MYRYAVMQQNLSRAFPDKSNLELQKIIDDYYGFLTDLMAENLKALSISEKELDERCTYENVALIEKLVAEAKSITILTAHYGNFEWMLRSINKHLPLQVYSFYNYIANPYFREEIVGSRTKNGLKLLLTTEAYAFYAQAPKQIYANIFASDQSPSNLKNVYWCRFLHQETAFLTGAARYSKMHDTAIVYMHIDRISRGRYHIRFNQLFDHCKELSTDQIMHGYVGIVEQQIIKKPELWLWSHKRWKHQKSKS